MEAIKNGLPNEKIMTAEDFLKPLQTQYEETGEYKMYFALDIPKVMKEFAEFHVKEALKAAKGACFTEADDILRAYPLTNIK